MANSSDTPHYEQDIPFEVPSGWVWCLLEELAYVAAGSTPNKDAFVAKGIPYIKMYNLRMQKIDFDFHPQYIKREIHEGKLHRSRTEIGDLLMNIVGPPLGKLAVIPSTLPEGNFNQAAVLIRPYHHKELLVKYLFYYLSEMSEINSISTKGSAGQVNISLTQSQNMRIPLPPLAEQQRIVEEIERWFKLIDVIEQGKADLQTTITQTKNKILDLAIHGKLVPQDPNDEPASELLKRINPKAGITCDNEHNGKLPPNWTFTKIKNVFEINPKTQADDNLDVAFVPMANISDGYRNLFTYDKRKWRSIKSGFTHFQNGDIAVAKISPCLENRKSVVFSSLPNGLGAGTTELHIFRSLGIDVFYALYFFKTNNFINQCIGTFNGVVGQQRIGKAIIENISFPLPPLSEQKRIVCKIEDLFSLINIVDKQLEE